MTDLTFELDRDPLRVLESTRLVLGERWERARFVGIDQDKVEETAELLAGLPEPDPDWSATLHPEGESDEERANLVLAVDALNFCFWSIPLADKPRWRVTYNGQTYDGYWALAAALRRAVEEGYPLADGNFLATITEADVAAILRPDTGTREIPLLRARMEHLQEAGKAILGRWDGSFLYAINAAHRSAPRLVKEVVVACPSFRDTVPWNRREIHFYKRAQILIADIFGAFEARGPGSFADMHLLTAFADYKVPQVLRWFGVLRYAPELADKIARHELIPFEADEEIEIRSATIWGVELLRQSLATRGKDMPAFSIDWALWRAGQDLPAGTEPYHRTLTVFY